MSKCKLGNDIICRIVSCRYNDEHECTVDKQQGEQEQEQDAN